MRSAEAQKRNNEYVRKWYKTESGRAYARRRYKNLREQEPEKYRAWVDVRFKLKGEKKPCEVCGVRKVDAHHEDYSKPLDVNWLCRSHHLARHYIFRACEVTDCQRKHVAKGLCKLHYRRLYRRLLREHSRT